MLNDIKRNLFVALLVLCCCYGCNREKEQVKAYVYKTTLFPLRYGFSLNVKYEFYYQGDTIRDFCTVHRRPIPHEGDSLRIEFPKGKPKRNKPISVIHVNSDKKFR